MIDILICGDFAPCNRVAKLIAEEKYDEIFSQVLPYTNKADYSILNLEAPVVLQQAKPIEKNGPNLKCSEKTIDALKYTGFDMATLANNHIYDYGEIGMRDTLQSLSKANINYVGAGKNLQEAGRVFYKEIKRKKMAFVNFCEHEFSIATKNSAGANPLNIVANYHQIQEAKENADYVIVIVHGGHEHYQLPSPRMKETYRFFIDCGANVVVNHHQHCYSGYEKYNDGLIFYGLGNFCFDKEDKQNTIWNEGYMLSLQVEDNKTDFELYPYLQCNDIPNVEILADKTDFEQTINRLNTIIADNKLLEKSLEEFCNSRAKSIKSAFEIYANRYLNALYQRDFLPSFLTKRKKLQIENFISCEAHRDIILWLLKSKIF
jgi:poly-gamma-glutamate synthesis protein (capsule biosynthesis protein)